jgi:hypothetical protein
LDAGPSYYFSNKVTNALRSELRLKIEGLYFLSFYLVYLCGRDFSNSPGFLLIYVLAGK